MMASDAAAAASQASSTEPISGEPPKVDTVPRSDSVVITAGTTVTRASPAVRDLTWLRPSAMRAANRPPTHSGVFLRTVPSIWGCWMSIWMSMVFLRWLGADSDQAELAPQQVAEIAPRQQREAAGHHTGAEVQALHRLAMAADVASGEEPERAEQAEQGHRNEQVNRREARDIGHVRVADEDRRDCRDHHQRDPGIAEGAVQPRVLGGALAGPERDRPGGHGQQGGGHVDGDERCELHIRLLTVCLEMEYAGRCGLQRELRDETLECGREMRLAGAN